MESIINREREDLLFRIRELTRDIRLKHLVKIPYFNHLQIIDNFIPAFEYMKIERRAEWFDEINDWQLPNLEYSGNNIKAQKLRAKEGDNRNKFLVYCFD